MKFLREETITGLQKLCILRLENTPAADSIEAVAMVWLEALQTLPISWNESQDKDRVNMAFLRLIKEADRWPSPKMLIERLPRRKETPKLPTPPISDAERRQNLKKMQEMSRKLAEKMTQNGDKK